jgi:hypothetical protein
LTCLKASRGKRECKDGVRNFIFRCPRTGFDVQGSIELQEAMGRKLVGQTCPACGGLHLVDPSPGKTASGAGDYVESLRFRPE